MHCSILFKVYVTQSKRQTKRHFSLLIVKGLCYGFQLPEKKCYFPLFGYFYVRCLCVSVFSLRTVTHDTGKRTQLSCLGVRL